MLLFWRERRLGQRLVLVYEDGSEEEVGGVRQTSKGFDAFAKTTGYEPGRSEKGFASLEEAKTFVESFRPWELNEDAMSLEVDPEVRPPSDKAAPTASPSPEPEATVPEETISATAIDSSTAPNVSTPASTKSWWEFWK